MRRKSGTECAGLEVGDGRLWDDCWRREGKLGELGGAGGMGAEKREINIPPCMGCMRA